MEQSDDFIDDRLYALCIEYLKDLNLYAKVNEDRPDDRYIALYSTQNDKLVAILNFDKCSYYVRYLYYGRACDGQFRVDFKHYILSEIEKYLNKPHVRNYFMCHDSRWYDTLKSRYGVREIY